MSEKTTLERAKEFATCEKQWPCCGFNHSNFCQHCIEKIARLIKKAAEKDAEIEQLKTQLAIKTTKLANAMKAVDRYADEDSWKDMFDDGNWEFIPDEDERNGYDFAQNIRDEIEKAE